jgi:hypothetical protein
MPTPDEAAVCAAANVEYCAGFAGSLLTVNTALKHNKLKVRRNKRM